MELIWRRDQSSRKATSTTDTIDEEHQDQEGGSEHKDEDSKTYLPAPKVNSSLVWVYSMLFAVEYVTFCAI